MGEIYAPYPKLPKNIRQIGERDSNVKLYVEDYVNTYLKRLYPAGGQDLRVGLLLGESRNQEGMPYLFADGALEMDHVVQGGEKIEFTEEAWSRAYHSIEQMFPKRTVLGWFICSGPDRVLSPLNYWKQHGRYFPEKNQLMYLSCGLEGEEAVYVASEDGFYKLRGYCIYYERNQMMQDYMVSRKDARRVETGSKDTVIQDFRQKMEDNQEEARKRSSTLGSLKMACGVLSVLVLASGVAMFNNYHRMKEMESVIASALPEGMNQKWSDLLGKEDSVKDGEDLMFEEVPGEVYPAKDGIMIEPESFPPVAGQGGEGSYGGTGSEGQTAGLLPGDAMQGAGQASETNPGTGEPGQETEGTGASGAENQESSAMAGGQTMPAESAGQIRSSDGAGLADQSGKGASGGAGAAGEAASAGGAGTISQPEESGNMERDQESKAEPVQVPANAIVHVVRDGDTLYGICLEYYHSVNNLPQICQWNQITDENRLTAGQELYLPPVK